MYDEINQRIANRQNTFNNNELYLKELAEKGKIDLSIINNYGYSLQWKKVADAYSRCAKFFASSNNYEEAQQCLEHAKTAINNMTAGFPVDKNDLDDFLLAPYGGKDKVWNDIQQAVGMGNGPSYPGGSSPYYPPIPPVPGVGNTNPDTLPMPSYPRGGETDSNQHRPNTQTTPTQTESNPYKFTFKELTEEDKLEDYIRADLPVFLHGKSGCGKSARIKEIDPDCEIIYLGSARPEVLLGKSIVVDGELKDIPPTWYIKLCEKCEKEPDKDHILFFDEMTNATPALQAHAFNIILDKEILGRWKLPPNVKIVAAGNEDKESLSANKLSEPLYRRFNHIYIETTLDKWLLWASKHNIHPAIYAYVASKGDGKDQVLRTECDGKGPCVDPRKWEMASKLLYKTNNPKALTAAIGKKLTEDFIRFSKIPVITLQQVIAGDYDENMGRLQADEGYATLIGLAACNEKDIEVVRNFVKKHVIPDQYQNFVMMWTKGDQKRIDMIHELDLLEQQSRKGTSK